MNISISKELNKKLYNTKNLVLLNRFQYFSELTQKRNDIESSQEGNLYEKEVYLESLIEGCDTKVELIDNAIKKFSSNQYGMCEVCEGPISLKRLRAVPEAIFCISCADVVII
jgi:DnaK suppressor protein